MNEKLELLSSPANFAVVQLPGRQYPGVVIQGDTLFSIVSGLVEMAALVEANDREELNVAIRDMHDQLQGALMGYEAVCSARGIELPYYKGEEE